MFCTLLSNYCKSHKLLPFHFLCLPVWISWDISSFKMSLTFPWPRFCSDWSCWSSKSRQGSSLSNYILPLQSTACWPATRPPKHVFGWIQWEADGHVFTLQTSIYDWDETQREADFHLSLNWIFDMMMQLKTSGKSDPSSQRSNWRVCWLGLDVYSTVFVL